MQATRRGFIGGLSALFAAPALVRAESLMPISALETYGPGGMLTPSMLAAEAARLWRERLRTRGLGFVPYVEDHGDLMNADTQVACDFSHGTQDLMLSLQSFSARWLRPSAYALADAAPLNVQIAPRHMGQPRGLGFCEIVTVGGTVRLFRSYDINRDQMITRLDTIYRI